jgi:hypothetical protein
MEILDIPIKHLFPRLSRNLKIKFPHIPRRIAARLRILVWLLIGILLFTFSLVNVYRDFTKSRTAEEKSRLLLIAQPFLPSLHTDLGNTALSLDMEYAKNEFLLAEQLGDNAPLKINVLGTSVENARVNSITDTEKRLKDAIEYWESVVTKYPTFAPAYQSLSILYEAIGDANSSKRMNTQYNVIFPHLK